MIACSAFSCAARCPPVTCSRLGACSRFGARRGCVPFPQQRLDRCGPTPRAAAARCAPTMARRASGMRPERSLPASQTFTRVLTRSGRGRGRCRRSAKGSPLGTEAETQRELHDKRAAHDKLLERIPHLATCRRRGCFSCFVLPPA